MPKLDKPIIGGDVSIETPPETIDPEMEVPEMLAPAPKTDTIYNPPMQQGVQQASMLNEFLKQATGEKPLASLNIGDYVQCATAKINLYPYRHFATSKNINRYIKFEVVSFTNTYNKLDVRVNTSKYYVTDGVDLLLQIRFVTTSNVSYKPVSIHHNNITLIDVPSDTISIDIYTEISNPDTISVDCDVISNILIYPSFKEEK